jgi:hypothetical protein
MEKVTFIAIGLIAVFGSYGIGLIEGSKVSNQVKADAYFAGQEEATKACKGEMNYE